jgi:hypothetical protein
MGCRPDGASSSALDAPAGPVSVQRAAVWPTGSMATLGFRLSATVEDTLLGVSVAGAEEVSMHRIGPGGRGMIPVAAIPVTAGEEVVLNEGQPHVMIMGLARPLNPGDSIRVVLRFSRAGERVMTVPVFRFTEAVRHIGN